MPRNNYEKVDSAMEAGLLRIKAEKLVKESEKKSNVNSAPENLRSAREKLAEVADQRKKERRLLATGMRVDIDLYFVKDRQLYTKLGTYHEEFMDLVAKSDSMDEEKWKRLMEIKEKLDAYKKEKNKKAPNDEKLIELERKKHINKRHNIKDNWLPLR